MHPEDFAGDAFLPAQVIDVRDGDIIRLLGRLWQVQHTLGFAFVARDLATGGTRQFGFATVVSLERRAGEPLEVEW